MYGNVATIETTSVSIDCPSLQIYEYSVPGRPCPHTRALPDVVVVVFSFVVFSGFCRFLVSHAAAASEFKRATCRAEASAYLLPGMI